MLQTKYKMDDLELFDLVHEGDKVAYKELYIKYYSPLCEFASQLISDNDAEELVQDLMLFVWENKKNIIIETSVKSYLFTATKFRCLNAIKKQQYHERIHSLIYKKLKDQFEDPNYYLVNELAENIEVAISELPDIFRDTFILSRFGDCTNSQIAEELGISIKTVEYRISKSLKILRVKLKDYLPFIIIIFS